jgi:hypothetical protein
MKNIFVKIIKISLLVVLQWCVWLALWEVYFYINPLKHNNIPLGIMAHNYLFVLLPIIIVIWNVVQIVVSKRQIIVVLFIFLILLVILYWSKTISFYPFRSIFAIFASILILFIGYCSIKIILAKKR